MRNKANDLLATVCLCDLTFFILMLPHSLATFGIFTQNISYRYYYLQYRQELSALANWISASAIWFIFSVTVERYRVVRRPLRSRDYWSKPQKFSAIIIIFLSTFLLTLYHHFEYDCQLVFFCNFTQIMNFCYSAGTTVHPMWGRQNFSPSEWRQYFIKISTVGNAVFVVLVPIILVAALTVLLIRQLTITDTSVLSRLDSSTRRSLNRQVARRKRVTITVITIASCFAITQGPSAVFSVWEVLIGYSHKDRTLFDAMSFRSTELGKRLSYRSDTPFHQSIRSHHSYLSSSLQRLDRSQSRKSEYRSYTMTLETLKEVSGDFQEKNQFTV
ncbi:unnamed protein product [Bursaphelenchus okinawaensis]|uniref:G-protein coupled receptors family 1 profile domain-containing protein n=1 Tax=Bursaphelenchus okinawaensis TaxID=465554 RepID=A0A811KYX4_9BILA|nr:unnamed protein product [Bursaphelenchus okinawaensis]CAG9114815.1 unnamed protein product [Bursaphelenchus okinawaensis]